MTTHKNTKQHTTIATLLLFSIGLLFSGNTFAWTHHIGEKYGGGIVFYVYDGGLHGLIAALADQSTGIQWYNGIYKVTGATGDGVGAGAMNTAMIVADQINDTPGGNFAAKLCADYSVKGADGVTYGDWYLPSIGELALLVQQEDLLDSLAGVDSLAGAYWSSTESGLYGAWLIDPAGPLDAGKDGWLAVRAVRAF